MTRTRSIALSLSVLSLAAGFAAGCGGGNDEGFRNDGSKIDGDPSTTLPAELASTKSTVKTRQAGEPLPEQKNITGISTDLKTKPKIPKATGTAPSELQGSDVVTGTGAVAKEGDKVTVEYVGALFKDGKEFDTSWAKGRQPFQFTVGQGQVIQGWDQGVAGMKIGGLRKLTIPAHLGYGARGAGGVIPPNATLVFEVELLGLR